MAGPFLTRHVYIQWGGSLPGQETWSCGLRFAPMGGAESFAPDDASLEGVLTTTIAPAISGFHTRPGSAIHSAAKLQFCKANFIKVDGRYEFLTTHEVQFANLPGGGSGSSVPPPNQCCLAITLRTDVTRGAANKGRFFMPLVQTHLVDATTGLLPADFVGAIEASATTLLENLNVIGDNQASDWPYTDWRVAVMSRKATGPATRRVQNIVVGRVVDTQRRRRRSLPESYVD